MNEIIVYHHLGLGDHFICNGLVNKLSETYFIHLICKNGNFDTIFNLYSENVNVKVIGIDNEDSDIVKYSKSSNLNILKIGFQNFCNATFDESFYKQFGYDLILRYNNFKLPKVSEWLYDKLITSREYCLISDQCSEGTFDLNVNNDLNKIHVRPGMTTNLLDYVKLIYHAKEIHCIDSAFYHLVDSVGTQANLFFHNDRNPASNKIRVSDKWTIV